MDVIDVKEMHGRFSVAASSLHAREAWLFGCLDENMPTDPGNPYALAKETASFFL